MTDEIVEDEDEFEVDKQYLVGLIDYLAKPTLAPLKSDSGYGLSTIVAISVRQSELIAGILCSSFGKFDIRHRIEYYNDGSIRSILIGDSTSIDKIHDIGEGTYVHNAEKLAYLKKINEKFSGVTITGNPEKFLQIFKPWADLHPEWNKQDARKYTLEFFRSELGIHTPDEEEQIPDVTYPQEITPQYVAGLFDAKGRVRLQVNPHSEYSIGYSLVPMVIITFANPHFLIGPHLKKFFQDTPVNPYITEESSGLTLNISGADNITSFLELIGGHTYYNFELCQLFYEQLVPAYKDKYHHEKEGFLDMLRAYEATKKTSRESQYDVAHFESIWDM